MIFPRGKFIYRGSHPESLVAKSYINQSPNYLRANLPVYFSTNKNSVRTYGTAVKYKTIKDLNLLDMSNVDQVSELINRTNSENIKKSIKKSFRITNGIIRRSSKLKHDIIVAVFICRLGYDGYYAPELRVKLPQGTFHPEIVLCNARKVLKVYNVKKMLNSRSEKIGVNHTIRKLVNSMFTPIIKKTSPNQKKIFNNNNKNNFSTPSPTRKKLFT